MKQEVKKILIPVLIGVLLLVMAVTFASFYTSASTQEDVSTGTLDIALVQEGGENGKVIQGDSKTSGGIAYAGMPGAKIDEKVAVRNDGGQDAYVRVIINRSWYRDGKKVADADINPRDIGIVTDTSGSDWFIDETSDPNGEQVICYYKRPLQPGAQTSNVMNAFTILADKVNENSNKYAGLSTEIKYKAYGVQSIGDKKAMLAEWGVVADFDGNGVMTSMPVEQHD